MTGNYLLSAGDTSNRPSIVVRVTPTRFFPFFLACGPPFCIWHSFIVEFICSRNAITGRNPRMDSNVFGKFCIVNEIFVYPFHQFDGFLCFDQRFYMSVRQTEPIIVKINIIEIANRFGCTVLDVVVERITSFYHCFEQALMVSSDQYLAWKRFDILVHFFCFVSPIENIAANDESVIFVIWIKSCFVESFFCNRVKAMRVRYCEILHNFPPLNQNRADFWSSLF